MAGEQPKATRAHHEKQDAAVMRRARVGAIRIRQQLPRKAETLKCGNAGMLKSDGAERRASREATVVTRMRGPAA